MPAECSPSRAWPARGLEELKEYLWKAVEPESEPKKRRVHGTRSKLLGVEEEWAT